MKAKHKRIIKEGSVLVESRRNEPTTLLRIPSDHEKDELAAQLSKAQCAEILAAFNLGVEDRLAGKDYNNFWTNPYKKEAYKNGFNSNKG